MSEPTPSKMCRKCGETKPLDEFPVSRRAKSGRGTPCRVCARASAAVYQKANPGKQEAWRRANVEHRREYQRQWIKNNPERVKAHAAKDYETNSARFLAGRAKRRGCQVIDNFTITELRAYLRILHIDPDLCFHCKESPREEWDHVIPIALGGSHTMGNVRPACFSCNRHIGWLHRKPNPRRAQVDEYRKKNLGQEIASAARQRGAIVVDKFTIDELIMNLCRRGIDPDTCFYCKTAPREQWDHYIPFSLQGEHTMENMRPACARCNRWKHSTHPDEWIPPSRE